VEELAMKTCFNTITAVSTLAFAGGVWAQAADRPWYLGLNQDFSHQSNPTLAVSGAEQASTVSTTTLRGGLNLPFGRQRAFAAATIVNNHYGNSNVSALGNTGYALSAGLDWSTVEHISGNVLALSTRRQADLDTGIATAVLRNDEKIDEVTAKFRIGGDSILAFEAGLGHRDVAYSAPEFAAQEYKLNNGSIGLTYRPSAALTLGTGLAAERTDFKATAVGQPAPDRSKRNDIYGTAVWVPTGASTLNARINIGKIEYDLATANNLSSVTGNLTWIWQPTGLLTFTTTAFRDTGQNSGFLQLVPGAPPTASDFSQINNTLGLGLVYALTSKVSITGNVSVSRRDLVDGFTGATGKDTTTVVNLGARWQALRYLSFGCNAGRESRSASGFGTADYKNNRYGCFGDVLLD
jgi:hypothetical protein